MALRRGRREWLKTVTRTGALGATALMTSPARRMLARSRPASSLDVGIVGAGLAGLSCADTLAAGGVLATVYDANSRTGGRCYSLRGFFPGQVAERGGELIDNLHKTMLGYANAFGLAREDYEKHPGEIFYYFGGVHYPDAAVVDEVRAFIAAMRGDLQLMSRAPTADSFNTIDAELARMSLAEYLETRGAGALLTAAVGEAYVAEYGRELADQSALNLLLFIKVDKRSRFLPFGS